MRRNLKPIVGGIAGLAVGYSITLLPRPADFIAIMVVLAAGIVWAVWALRDLRRMQREVDAVLAKLADDT